MLGPDLSIETRPRPAGEVLRDQLEAMGPMPPSLQPRAVWLSQGDLAQLDAALRERPAKVPAWLRSVQWVGSDDVQDGFASWLWDVDGPRLLSTAEMVG